MVESKRATARDMAQRHLQRDDPLGWFEKLYARAGGDPSIIPWADLTPNPNLISWLEAYPMRGEGKRALKVGCGLGDDAEELAGMGFQTSAFDISATAIAWCKRRFPDTRVHYRVQDLFRPPTDWTGHFDFVLESYTLQVLPPGLRQEAIKNIAGFVKPDGILLVISRGREASEPEGKMPWPLTSQELDVFKTHGLEERLFEDYVDDEDPPVRRFSAVYERRQY